MSARQTVTVSELEAFYTKSSRMQIQEGTLSTSIGSLLVSAILFGVYELYDLNVFFSYFGFSILFFCNIARIYFQFQKHWSDEIWLKRVSVANAMIAFGFCSIMLRQFASEFNFHAIVLNYIVINALVAAYVFWQFMRIAEVYAAIVTYLSTAAIGVFFWSDNQIYTVFLIFSILTYMVFLAKQVTFKQKNWMIQKTDEFEMRKLMQQLPSNLFGQEVSQTLMTELSSVQDLHAAIFTKIKKQLQELQESERELAKVDKMASIGEMVSGIMHEINNPIAIIASRVQLLERHIAKAYPDDASLFKHFEVISRNAFRASKIISGTKALVRETNEQNFQWATVGEIRMIFEDSMNLKLEQSATRIEIVFNECADSTPIFCFPIQIGQVLINLASNSVDAVKHLPSEARWVRIIFEKNQDFIIVRAQDSGKGIGQDIAQKIEKPFFTSKKPGEGSGLGLHISRRIVESHKGKLYYNPVSENTEFVIELPILKQAS